MILTGAVVNALAVFVGSAVGLLLKKGLPERMRIKELLKKFSR